MITFKQLTHVYFVKIYDENDTMEFTFCVKTDGGMFYESKKLHAFYNGSDGWQIINAIEGGYAIIEDKYVGWDGCHESGGNNIHPEKYFEILGEDNAEILSDGFRTFCDIVKSKVAEILAGTTPHHYRVEMRVDSELTVYATSPTIFPGQIWIDDVGMGGDGYGTIYCVIKSSEDGGEHWDLVCWSENHMGAYIREGFNEDEIRKMKYKGYLKELVI